MGWSLRNYVLKHETDWEECWDVVATGSSRSDYISLTDRNGEVVTPHISQVSSYARI